MELPRITDDLFPDDPDAQDLVDFLVNTCENQVFSAECAAASRGVQDKISENNDKYKGEQFDLIWVIATMVCTLQVKSKIVSKILR